MSGANNRDRVLRTGLQLFNRRGISGTSTNHIAAAVGISPGNLYYHFRDKEELLRELFGMMAFEVELLWRDALIAPQVPAPRTLVTATFEMFWRYRCFHREMYHLRRKDRTLSRQWKAHMSVARELLVALLGRWGAQNVEQLATLLLVAPSSFLQVFESGTRRKSSTTISAGVEFILGMLDASGRIEVEAPRPRLRLALAGPEG